MTYDDTVRIILDRLAPSDGVPEWIEPENIVYLGRARCDTRPGTANRRRQK